MTRRTRRSMVSVVALFALAVTVAPAFSSSVLHRNVVDLIELSERIIVGEVLDVSDGFDNNVPYTQVTVRVDESIRGANGGTYTFRQFGLIEPRPMANGQVNLNVTPDGWPRYEAGREIMLFLYKQAEMTGLQTTVGLFQGKFDIQDGQITNLSDNQGLFQKLRLDGGLLDAKESALLSHQAGQIDSDTFVSFVKKAVDGRWVEQGRMINAQQ